MFYKISGSFLMLCMVVCLPRVGYSQIKKENIKIGFASGVGTQNRYPFNLSDYQSDVLFYKVQLNYILKQKRRWAFETHVEPSYYVVEHQLLNKWFIKEGYYDDYEDKRELFMQKRTIKEYVLNFGFAVRYKIAGSLSTYAIGSIGPMISDKATERLAKGFAFSDVFGIGISYQIKSWELGFRYSIRHTSNLDMKYPNSGHNTTNTELSILYQL
ncbi:acyloxyacyl hydrolase [Flavisericum labens]|uniref:acyloxyacyl hydrolase n=1 Tax=Flavisericum labens TaxID=3377112 RepID=UPI00387B88F8